MIEYIHKHKGSPKDHYTFSVLIPSWNNLEYLKFCINSIIKNSTLDIQIIVIINEGQDGTVKWINEIGQIDFVHAEQNIGICYGLNSVRSLIKSDYVVYVNDDMYVLPGWDTALHEEILSIGGKAFMLSGTMIEAIDTNNPCVVVRDYGRDIAGFDEKRLLNEFESLKRNDWTGSMWPPNVIHVDVWDLVGGMSIEFSPGMYSDPDLARKLYQAGVRIFKGKGNCLVYHFGSKTTRKLKKQKGKKIFLLKWGITSNTFATNFLKLGKPYSGPFENIDPEIKPGLINRIKRLISSW